MWAEKSNAERYATHFSAFDLSAKPGFFFIRVGHVSTPLKRVDAEIAEAEDSNSRFALRIATLEYWIVNETGCNKWLGLQQVARAASSGSGCIKWLAPNEESASTIL